MVIIVKMDIVNVSKGFVSLARPLKNHFFQADCYQQSVFCYKDSDYSYVLRPITIQTYIAFLLV